MGTRTAPGRASGWMRFILIPEGSGCGGVAWLACVEIRGSAFGLADQGDWFPSLRKCAPTIGRSHSSAFLGKSMLGCQKGKYYILILTYGHELWGSDQKNKIADASSGNELPPECGWPLP